MHFLRLIFVPVSPTLNPVPQSSLLFTALYCSSYLPVTHECLWTNYFKTSFYDLALFFILAQQPPVGQGLLHSRSFLDHTRRRTTFGIRLLWTSDNIIAEISTWQHTTLTTDRHSCPGGIRTHNLNRRAAADLRLRRRGHWDRHVNLLINNKYSEVLTYSPSY